MQYKKSNAISNAIAEIFLNITKYFQIKTNVIIIFPLFTDIDKYSQIVLNGS